MYEKVGGKGAVSFAFGKIAMCVLDVSIRNRMIPGHPTWHQSPVGGAR